MLLDEMWKTSYENYLAETENSINDVMIELIESQNEVLKGYQYIIEYFEILGEETKLEEAVTMGGASVAPMAKTASDEVKEKKNTFDDGYKETAQSAINFFVNSFGRDLLDAGSGVKRDIPEYKVEGVASVERISDMKFPKNIIFFIQQVIAWIKRVVVYFIEKIKNIFNALIGRTDKIVELNPEALKLQLTKAKKLETITSFRPDKEGKPSIVKAYAIKADDIKPYYALRDLREDVTAEALEESFADIVDSVVVKGDDDKHLGKGKAPVVVTLDISKDLMNLRELTQHFYDLYDSAFGSNNENLFTAEDLKLILGLFKDTVSDLKSGNVNTVEVGSYAVEVSAIDASRIRENLVRTNTNIEHLKDAYLATSNKIKDITKIITHKELLMLNSYGIDKKWLTSSTYEQIIAIVKTIKPRLKDAEKNEKALTKMKNEYEKISAQLLKMQSYFLAINNVSYTTVYQRRVVDLCNAARYMTQLTTLRLTGLGMYIKEMKDIRDLLKAVSNVSNAQ